MGARTHRRKLVASVRWSVQRPRRRLRTLVAALIAVIPVVSSPLAVAQSDPEEFPEQIAEAIPTPGYEEVATIAQPSSEPPVFNSLFGNGFASIGSRASVAVGEGRVFIASHDRVRAFDAESLAPVGNFSASDARISQVRGLAFYRGELFVADDPSDRVEAVLVFNHDGGFKRRLPASGLGENVSRGIGGIDVAWGEIWLEESPVQPTEGQIGYTGPQVGLLRVLDAQSGALKGEIPIAESEGPWEDVAAVPELNQAIIDFRGVPRGILGLGIAGPGPEGSLAASSCPSYPCELPEGAEGIDAPWGMKWLLSVSRRSSAGGGPDDRGRFIDEFALASNLPVECPDPLSCDLATFLADERSQVDGGLQLSHRRRWSPVQQDGTVSDVAYNKRQARLEWNGDLTDHAWQRGTRCLDYVVSDADIFIVGNRAERWYERARGFEQITISVDGVVQETRTGIANAAGKYCLDTDALTSGVHSISAVAQTDQGRVLKITNDDLRIDHDAPTGAVAQPPPVVQSTARISGQLADSHSGPRDWRLEASQEGANNWGDICTVAAPGTYSCDWNTTGVADGPYSVRAQLRDLVSPSRGGPNSRATSAVRTIVDNTDPAATLSGSLHDAADLRPLHDPNRYPLHVEATDSPGSGVRSIEILIDGIRVDRREQGCPAGACSMAHDFSFDPTTQSDGIHTVRVVVTDHAGHTDVSEWQVDVEKVAPLPEDETDETSATSTPTALMGATATVASVASAPPETPPLLPCTQPNEPTNFGVYSLGGEFEGLPLKALLRRCSVPYPEEGTRANFVSYIYGDCETPIEGDAWCTPPLEVQSWPSCERNLSSYERPPELGPMPYEPLEIQGVPAADIWVGQRIEIYAGDTTIVIFGHDSEQILRAAWEVRKVAAGEPPSPSDVALPADASGDLPEPVDGVLDGTVSCVGAIARLGQVDPVPTYDYMAKGKR